MNGDAHINNASMDSSRVLREVQVSAIHNENTLDLINGEETASQTSLHLRNGNSTGTIGHYHVSDGLSTMDEEHDLELITERRRTRRSRRARNDARASPLFDDATTMFILTNEQIQSVDSCDYLDEIEDNLEYNLILIRRRRPRRRASRRHEPRQRHGEFAACTLSSSNVSSAGRGLKELR